MSGTGVRLYDVVVVVTVCVRSHLDGRCHCRRQARIDMRLFGRDARQRRASPRLLQGLERPLAIAHVLYSLPFSRFAFYVSGLLVAERTSEGEVEVEARTELEVTEIRFLTLTDYPARRRYTYAMFTMVLISFRCHRW